MNCKEFSGEGSNALPFSALLTSLEKVIVDARLHHANLNISSMKKKGA